MRRWAWILLLALLVHGVGHAVNETSIDVVQLLRKRLGAFSSGFVLSGCAPVASGVSLAAFACEGAVIDNGLSIPVVQAATAVGPLVGGDGTYWLALYKDRTSAVAGWTRQAGSHYLWRQLGSLPADPAGGTVFAKVTVVSGGITAIADWRKPASYATSGVHSLKDRLYGCVGDGVADDTACVQAALNSNAGMVTCPPGEYKITSTLTAARGLRFLGLGAAPGGTTSPDPNQRWRGCVLNHDFNGTFFNVPGVAGDVVASIGFTLENLILRQTFGTGSGAAGIAVNVVATSDDHKASWVQLRGVNMELTPGSVDDWTWNFVADGDATTSTAAAGSRDHVIVGGRWWGGTNALGAIKIRAGANIHITDTLLNGPNPHISISGADASHATSNTHITAVAGGDAILQLNFASGTVCAGCNLADIDATANTSGTMYSGVINAEPAALSGTTNVVQSGQHWYFDNGTQPRFKNMEGQTVVRLDGITAASHYLQFLDAGSPLWNMGKAADNSWFLSHLTHGGIVVVDPSGLWRHSRGTIHASREPTYGATVTMDLALGDIQQITVTDTAAFTITFINRVPNQIVTVIVRNDSGGAMGVITWDVSGFAMAGAFTNPADNHQRAIVFRSGTKLEEISRTADDVQFQP